MTLTAIPTRLTICAVAGAALAASLALFAGIPVAPLKWAALALAGLLVALMFVDSFWTASAWRKTPPALLRRMPQALAIGVPASITLQFQNAGSRIWQVLAFDFIDSGLQQQGLPASLKLAPESFTEFTYSATPQRRGEIRFGAAQLRVRSHLRLLWLTRRLGAEEHRRVFPDFAQISRYAWLAGDRRLAELGVKTWQRRGEGTDFKQLTEYRPGDPARHIDWKATLRSGRPILREFQDERDQNVLVLLDCGRRMRSEESDGRGGHFDQVLNSVVLLSYVALKQGDAVGVQTFGVPAGEERYIPPRKGGRALDHLMTGLYDQQPRLAQPDYVAAAIAAMRRLRRRSLVIIVTNFRDEDSAELEQALQLLRTRHLVLLASVREAALREVMEQPLINGDAALQVATAHWFDQKRRTAFARLAANHGLMVDAEPARLGVDLVNRYRAAKSAGVI